MADVNLFVKLNGTALSEERVSIDLSVSEAKVVRQVVAWFRHSVKEGTTVGSADQNLLAQALDHQLGICIAQHEFDTIRNQK